MTIAQEVATREFVFESEEQLDRFIVTLGRVERGEHTIEDMRSVYRDLISLKGSAQLFGFHQMGKLAHCMEASFDPVTKGRVTLVPEFVDALYAAIDALKGMLNDVKVHGAERNAHAALAEVIPRLVDIVPRLLSGSLFPFQEALPQPEPKTAAALVGDRAGGVKVLSSVETPSSPTVAKTRMQPIGNILTKFHRVVRDMARDLGKQIELVLEGTDTELDKTLIEAVRDPITHIIRNAIDHGLEAPADRKTAGKSESGRIRVRAFHEGGQVIVEIQDDGCGLSRKRIGAKAVERGLLSKEAVDRLSDREVNQLIFLPGFSTAESISNISGRGVGMDVVKTNIEKIGGVVDLDTIEGSWTVIRLKIPSTSARRSSQACAAN